ncbi:MAG TPA: SRPBCC domain-containing protein [Devosia sp.]|jgi:uncharacterized protein YndB with AHSA1/START domain|uniref:SRPBCC family protein n=1 Tax=Devosia sp. TaxID=1871048 RepID=UPI002F92C944
MTLQTVVVEQPIAASPERVWERISTPSGIAQWWRPGEIAPIVGHEFTMDMDKWGQIPCRVIEVHPGEKLAYTFGDFELHWSTKPAKEGCVLLLEHRGFDLDNPQHRFAFENMGSGWRTIVLPRLAEGVNAAA